MLPFDSEHLTEPERALQRQQEKRDCRTCKYMGRDRGGRMQCTNEEFLRSDEYFECDVLAGWFDCEWYC